MSGIIKSIRPVGVIVGGMIVATVFVATSAMAGECPADKVKANAMKPVSTPGSGYTDTVLATIDLSKESIKAKDRVLRIRRLVFQPGAIVPWHSHDDRPALLLMIEGEMVEYRNTCLVPILHKTGEVAREVRGTSHWWKNESGKVAVMIASDILHDRTDKNM
jgi:quercetin dioxygenase-like cupin family protein